MAPKTLTTAEVATQFETTPRTLRKFLRDDARANDLPIAGKGSRWSLEARKVASLRKRFAKWEAAQAELRAAREAKKAEEANDADAPDETADDAVDAGMTLDDIEGPSDTELDEIDAN